MFEFLRNGDVVSIILSAEVLFSVIFTLSLFIAVHALLTFVRQSNGLYTRLAQIEAELHVLQAGIPGKAERIRSLHETLEPLRRNFRRVQEYYSRLQHIDRRWQAEQMEKEREEEEGREKQIQRQRMGLDRFI